MLATIPGRSLNDWLNVAAIQIRTVSDSESNSTSDNAMLDEHKDQEPCIISSSSSDGKKDEIEGENQETDCSTSETLTTLSARSSPVPVPVEELDNSVTEQDCDRACCKVDRNFPFQPQDKETLNSFAKGGRNFMCKWYKLHPWLTACESRKKAFCFIVSMPHIMVANV